jgi:poly(A) polymerase
MLRAVALAARLQFTIDRDTVEAMRFMRGEIVKSSPARLLDEFYKILRQGASRRTFELLHETGLLAYLLPEADQAISEGGERLLGSLTRLDEYRNAGLVAPEGLTNAILLGTLLVPLGVPLRRATFAPRRREPAEPEAGEEARDDGPGLDLAAELSALGEIEAEDPSPQSDSPSPIALPFARRDVDRLRLILLAQRRLREVHRSPGAQHLLAGRGYFEDSVRWLEIHGGVEGQELAAHWRSPDLSSVLPGAPPDGEPAPAEAPRRSGRRRRRRRRSRSTPSSPA